MALARLVVLVIICGFNVSDFTSSSIPFKPLAATFGAELDLALLHNSDRDAVFQQLGAAVRAHKVVALRNAQLDRPALHRLAQQLGQPLRYPFSNGVEGFPEMIEIRRSPEQRTAMSTLWHSDSTYLATPPAFTMLYGVLIPPIGGNTLFADTVAAFEALSPTLQAQLRQLRVVQRSDVHADNERLAHLSKPSAPANAMQASHPAVITSDCREALYVSEEHTAHFEGMTRAESLPLIEFLSRHVAADRFSLAVRWEPDTLVIHDNRKTIHRAVDNYYGYARTLLRIIVGDIDGSAEDGARRPEAVAA